MGKSRGERRVIFSSSGAIQIICLCRHELGDIDGGRRVVEILRRLRCLRLLVDEESVKGEDSERLRDAIVGLCFPPSHSAQIRVSKFLCLSTHLRMMTRASTWNGSGWIVRIHVLLLFTISLLIHKKKHK